MENIFDPFFSTKEQGHGLGLSAVLGVVQALQGSLQVQSDSNKGSTFSVYLPANSSNPLVDDFDAKSSIQESAHKSPPEQLVPDELVLVIDDEDTVREAIVDMLDSAGYRTVVAANGYDGLTIFEQQQDEIGTVVLDVVMPGINGLETLQRLRAMNATVPVILCSGYSDTTLPGAMLQHPSTTFLAKPYTLQQLIKVMATVG